MRLFTMPLGLASIVLSLPLQAAPLYSTPTYYDGFAADDTDSWARAAFNTASITNNLVDGNVSYSYTSGTSNPSGYFVGKLNANPAVQNTLGVGEKLALSIDIPTSSFQGGTYAAVYVTDSATPTDGSSVQNTWMMLSGTSFSGTRGWHVLDGSSWALKSEVASAGSNPFWVEYSRPDSSTLIGTVYTDAALTNPLFSQSFSGVSSLGAELYVGIRLNSRALNTTWDDVTIAAIPEPASLGLMAAGLAMMAGRRRKCD